MGGDHGGALEQSSRNLSSSKTLTMRGMQLMLTEQLRCRSKAPWMRADCSGLENSIACSETQGQSDDWASGDGHGGTCISRWLVGSSSSRMCAWLRAMLVNTTRAFCPPAITLRSNGAGCACEYPTGAIHQPQGLSSSIHAPAAWEHGTCVDHVGTTTDAAPP